MTAGGLFSLFEAACPADSTTPFIETADGRVMTYGDMMAISAGYAGMIRESGLVKGDRLLSVVDNSPETVCLYLACLRAGIIYVPANTAYQGAELSHLVGDAQPSLVVCRPDRLDRVESLIEGIPVLTLDGRGHGSLPDGGRNHGGDFVAPAIDGGDVAAILYTSGTTGRPKGAMLTHGLLAWKARVLADTWAWRSDDVLLHVMPLCHTHGLFMSMNCVLARGGRMIMLPRFDVDAVIRWLPRASVFTGVPTMYNRLLAHPGLNHAACRGMRLFVSGSAPLLAETFRAFRERTGHEIVECWGMTETLSNASNPVDGERRPGTAGVPVAGAEIRVAAPDGRELPAGNVGMLEVRGRESFAGYWRNPAATQEAFRPDGFFVTGDLGMIDERGYVVIAGRAKEMIITGGYNVYAREVEVALLKVEGVAEAAVFGVEHPDFGEGVTAAIEMRPGASTPSEEKVLGLLKAELANYKVPKRVLVVGSLPRSVSGKVRKAALRRTYRDLYRGP